MSVVPRGSLPDTKQQECGEVEAIAMPIVGLGKEHRCSWETRGMCEEATGMPEEGETLSRQFSGPCVPHLWDSESLLWVTTWLLLAVLPEKQLQLLWVWFSLL